jgi:predicted branched-subunit amino acid permease
MNKLSTKYFFFGVKRMLPIIPGVVPFGLIMGSAATSNDLTLFQTMGMNIFVFAGASQLAAIELFEKNAPAFVIILTGIIINLRFIMYSTSMAPVVAKLDPFKKIGLAYFLTDQSYAVTSNEEASFNNHNEKLSFYFGTSLCMFICWQLSVFAGVFFGNIVPASWSLDFVVPLAFMSLIVPSLRNKTIILVALTSFCFSIIFYDLPYNLGLIVTAFSALGVGVVSEIMKEKNDLKLKEDSNE